jgi:fatty-acyl-CoA synthase
MTTLSTMQDFPLSISAILRHGERVYPESECVTWTDEGPRRASFAEVGANAARLANALACLGVRNGDRVGTFCWNNQEHLEAYLAVPAMGAVLHTLNIRLFPEQLAYVINHAQDKVVIVDDSLIPMLVKVASELTSVERYIVVGAGDVSALSSAVPGAPIDRYAELLANEAPSYEWPEIDERQAAAMCYTSGTTGNPKGVAYSHRSAYLHSLAATTPAALNLSERERILTIVPMFHANAWGIPYAAFMCGASVVMPGRFLQAEPLTRMIKEERVTFSGAVPTIWADILRYGEDHEIDLSSVRMVVCGGSAVPRSLMERFQERYGVRIVQGWGMTETSPLAAVGHAPASVEPGSVEEMDWRARTGRVVSGVELRIVDDQGNPLPWDDEAVGEIEVRGPWITASYCGDPSPEKFDNGWLRTGDVGTVNALGFVQITDRAKDVIKSGGEWISSIEIENLAMGHPKAALAAVIGAAHPKWSERPVLLVKLKPGETATKQEFLDFLEGRIARWWMPDDVVFVDEIPLGATGKIDKKLIREQMRDYVLPTVEAKEA